MLTTLILLHAQPFLKAEEIWPMPEWKQARPSEVDMDGAQLHQARDYALTGGGSGIIVRHGKLVLSWGDTNRRYDLKSTTKSIGVTALGLAIADDKSAWRTKPFSTTPASACLRSPIGLQAGLARSQFSIWRRKRQASKSPVGLTSPGGGDSA